MNSLVFSMLKLRMVRLILCVLMLFLPSLIDSARILIAFTFPSKSHNILGEGICRALLNEGHKVTYMSAFPKKSPPPNMRYVDLSDIVDANLIKEKSPLKSIGNTQFSLSDVQKFFTKSANMSASVLLSDKVQKFMMDPSEKFDLVIVEWMFNEPIAGLSVVFDCPLVWFSSLDPHWQILQLIDGIPNPAYTPDGLSGAMAPFTFGERVLELIKLGVVLLLRNLFVKSWDRETYIKHIGPLVAKKGRTLPDYDEMLYNASLVLGNSHISTGKAINLPHNYKSVGGYHIDPNVKPLPADLQKIFDSAKHGVIYFSLGSNLESKDLPEGIQRSLLNMFGKLKYTVIWKFEAKLKDLPPNVHVLEWAPQQSILSHPNCQLFITHGGLLSSLETIHFKVPTIGIPIFADQPVNVERAVKKGYAIRVDLAYDMADKLKEAIEEILGHPKYKQKVEELSFIFHDRPVPPAKELAHWVNHVIATEGAPHLRSPALMVPWYQKVYLDFLALIFVVIYVFVKIIKLLCCSKKTVDKNLKAKKHN